VDLAKYSGNGKMPIRAISCLTGNKARVRM
jgi:hypothetical protein